MSLRWYSVVIDSHDPAALARWWAQVLDWQVIFEEPDEVVIVPGWAAPEELAALPWERIPQGFVFVPVPEGKTVKNRLHLDLAPQTGDDRDAMIEQVLATGASRVDVGQSADVTWTVLADPEGNEFCVLSSRDR